MSDIDTMYRKAPHAWSVARSDARGFSHSTRLIPAVGATANAPIGAAAEARRPT